MGVAQYANKEDLSGAEALYGLYYLAIVKYCKTINVSFEEIKEFLKENSERNKRFGLESGMVNSCHGAFIGVNVAHVQPDVSEYDAYYGSGTAEKAFEFARAMKKAAKEGRR